MLRIVVQRLRVELVLVYVILSAYLAVTAFLAFRYSPTLDEPAHLAAGISHWQLGKWDLYSVNPPLVRLLAAVPAVIAGAETDWTSYISGDARPEFLVGRDFVSVNGGHTLQWIRLGRAMCLPFGLIGALACFFWAKNIAGTRGGLLALLLWCTNPCIISHGSLITPDVAGASLAIAASYVYWQWMRTPAWTTAYLAGTCLGLAVLCKSSNLILVGAWGFAVFGIVLFRRQNIARIVGMFVVKLFLSIVVINSGYGMQNTCHPLDSFSFKSVAGRRCSALGSAAGLGRVPVPYPAAFVVGLDLQQCDFENFDVASYMSGEFRTPGWPTFYLYALSVKLPVGLIWLSVSSLSLFCQRGTRSPLNSGTFLLCVCALSYIVVASVKTGINHHPRYVLPSYGFMFVLLSCLVCHFPLDPTFLLRRLLHRVAIAYSMASMAWTYPHVLSYFNEASGGPCCGHCHLLFSAIDWGQDLFFARDWLTRNGIDSFALCYYGGMDPTACGVVADVSFDWPDTQRLRIISINSLLAAAPSYYGDEVLRTPTDSQCTRVRNETPICRLGYSLWVFPPVKESRE